jgi:DNA polymerase
LTISRGLGELIEEVSAHRAGDRFDLLYGLVWRYVTGEKSLLEKTSDPSVLKALNYARAVRRDIHKMHAFLRFRESERDGRPFFSAWFEPQHHTLKRALPFFTGRFASMDWLIATPEGSAAWRDRKLTFGPGAPKPGDADDAVLDTLWNTYFQAIFNPARLHVNAMLREMPKRYWRDMPETKAIPDMLRTAQARTLGMADLPADAMPRFAARVADQRAASVEAETARMSVTSGSLAEMRQEALGCTRCLLHANATQTVFGEGPEAAPLMFVGEQPGDQEDLAGKPFIGPAGQLFDTALGEADIERARAYITNAVKHFKFEPRGKRRIHQKPNAGEVQACRWWLTKEIALVKPRLIVALGATAAQSLAGRPVAIMKERGRVLELNGTPAIMTVHPSYLLRLPDADAKAREFAKFVEDLKLARATLAQLKAA